MSDDERVGEPQRAQLLKGLTELALLSVLADQARYGLDILECLRNAAGLPLAEGTIYPLLHRLEQAKFTKAEWRLDENGVRPRKYYALTKLGRAQLERQLSDWRQLSASLNKFLARGRR